MKILFATMAPFTQDAAGSTSALASARYRVILPAEQLSRLGHEVQVASRPPDGWPKAAFELPCDVLVVSKSFHSENESLARVMKDRGAKVVVDICDDHFAHPEHGKHLRNLIALADQVVASTPAMAESIHRNAARDSLVVSDPVEGRRGVPQFMPKFPALRIVWFGHPSNVGGVAEKAQDLIALAAKMPVHLSLVTAPWPQLGDFVAQLNALSPARLKVEVVPWSTDTTWRMLEQSDMAWIPVASASEKAVKSPNRLLEALWAGRLVVADEVPSYMPFADVTPVGQALPKAVADAFSDRAGVAERLREAQRRISATHSPFACGRGWAHAVGDVAPRPLRLNLGCGDKILPGYVNVDIVEARSGMRPDVICDLHDLAPFSDASVDEILSVHVVEHFWRWEVRDILREWARTLRSGGKMIIECPNLVSACRTFLENPVQFSREDQNGQRTMWVFYGDPESRDPLMIHRWGYTPDSLKSLLVEAGLVDVRQEPAQFKLREPRDMRVVGMKP